MLSNIGIILLIFTLFSSLAIIFTSYESLKKKINFIETKIYKLSLYQVTFSILSFFILLTGFVISDFSLANVFENSHSAKPMMYKIAATWGSHEGSLLLWINILVIFSYFPHFYNFSKKKKNVVKKVLIDQKSYLLD